MVAKCFIKHGLRTPNTCKLCNCALESISHVLLECIHARDMCSYCNVPIPRSSFLSNLHENFGYILNIIDNIMVNEKATVRYLWWLWGLWKHRNKYLFEIKHGDINALFTISLDEDELWSHQQDHII